MIKHFNFLNMIKIDTRFLLVSLLVTFLVGCSADKKGDNQTQPGETLVEYEPAPDKKQLAEYYNLPHMKEWYQKRVLPPKFNFDMDLSSKSYIDLLLLQNEIYARNGYLFMDASLRGYFNQFKWYQPVFDIPDFKVQLDEQEVRFINKILKLKKEKFGTQYITQNGYKLVNPDFVFNQIQFQHIDEDLLNHFRKMNFAMVPANREQLFYIYDENQYQYIPNFYTTDLYLQLLHKYMASLLESVEGERMISLITEMTLKLYNISAEELRKNQDASVKESIAWANTYHAIAYTVISGQSVPVDPAMKKFYSDEVNKINQADGMGSAFLQQWLFDYGKFKPVGNYTKDDTLKHYFRGVKWLSLASMTMENEVQLKAAAVMALWIANDPDLQKNFLTFNSIIGSFAGDEDGASVSLLINVLKELDIRQVGDLTKQNLEKIGKRVNQLKVDRIRPKGADEASVAELSKDRIFFTAGRYTFDSEILIRLVNLLPKATRPFPKGLDVFASLGNEEAKNILLHTYKENSAWPHYSDTLSQLTKELAGFSGWERSIYNKTMECINAINLPDEGHPLFMKTSFWQRKNLSTSLAAWTELKHDLTLYTEQAGGAEAGEGGGPPPPVHLSYVEPNVKFWKKSIELIDYQLRVLSEAGFLDDESRTLGEDIKEEGQFFLKISEKELKHELITNEEFSQLTWMGGNIERLTFRVVRSSVLAERERQIALAADVYSFNSSILEEAVGLGDEIYVIAEINGYPYITKGACFSYYEFKTGQRLTDEEWQEQISAGRTQSKPIWLKELYSNTLSLETKPGYSF